MGLGGTLRRMARTCVRVERTGGYFDRGRWIDASPEKFEIRANVQPAPPEAIERLPEGSRSTGAVVIFPGPGARSLQTARAGDGGHNADRVTIDGEIYEIASSESWRQHRRYTATRFGQ